MSKNYKIKGINGKKHLVEKGTFGDFDHGALHKNPLTGKWETRDNVSLKDTSGGLFGHDEKFGVEKSNGRKGTMERNNHIFGEDDYHYEEEGKRESTGSSELSDWFWFKIVLVMLFLPLTLIILAVSAIVGGVSSYLDSPGSSIGKSVVRFILKILDVALMAVTLFCIYGIGEDVVHILRFLGAPRTMYLFWGSNVPRTMYSNWGLDIVILILFVAFIILFINEARWLISPYLNSPGSSIGKSVVRVILKILDVALMPMTFYYIFNGAWDTIYIFRHLGVPRTMYPGWGWAVVVPGLLVAFIILFINEVRWLISPYTSTSRLHRSSFPRGWKIFLKILDTIAIVVTFGAMYFFEGVTIFRYEITDLPNIHTWIMVSPFALIVVIIIFIYEINLLFR